MSINTIGAFTGQLPDPASPATFDARAKAMFDWLVSSLVADFNLSASQVNGVLGEIKTALNGSGDLLARFDDLGDLSELDRGQLVKSLATWKAGSNTESCLISANILRQVIAAQVVADRFDSGWRDFANSGHYVMTHNLGYIPREVSIDFQAKYAENGFAVGDVIQGAFWSDGDGADEGVSVIKTSSKLKVTFAPSGAAVMVKPDGGLFIVSAGRWKYRVTARQ